MPSLHIVCIRAIEQNIPPEKNQLIITMNVIIEPVHETTIVVKWWGICKH